MGIFSNQVDDPMFEHRVAAGEFVEVSPGVFQTREAAEWPLAALADFHVNGRDGGGCNVGCEFICPGGEDGDSIDRFCNSISNPRRND